MINIKNTKTIIGAIAGDVIGSIYEFDNEKSMDFDMFLEESVFTDDTVLTIAIADALLHKKDFAKTVWAYGREHWDCGFGKRFKQWLQKEDRQPYLSFGNGSAMRVSPIGFAYNDLKTVLEQAKKTAAITHNHSEGIRGAQAIAGAIFLARTKHSKAEIRDFIVNDMNYNLDFTIDSIRPFYKFDVSCQGSVPQAINAFLESVDYENAIRKAISIGGDSDTIACMAGGIAAAYYNEIPEEILDFVDERLPDDFKNIICQFEDYIQS